MIDSLNTLIDKINNWMAKEIPDGRLESDSFGRPWFLKSIEYQDKLILEDLKNCTDRTELNKEFKKRYLQEDVQARQGVSATKVEITALYSFNKCFAQRYKGRLHFYRDDLSQKGKRNMATVGQAIALFEEFKKNLS